jgi:hypothetical protein
MLQTSDLFSLEQYARIRTEFRKDVVAHKKQRQIALGDHITLSFEDDKTIKYQIQEMLRIEKTFEPEGIQDELDAYNPLIPNGTNLKATMLIEYGDPEIRKVELQKLVGVEHKVYMQVDGHNPVFAIADEDMERSTENKTSAVHFMRFEFTPKMISDIKSGKKFILGVDHEQYQSSVEIVGGTKQNLVKDFN